jgi:hypothetical protein
VIYITLYCNGLESPRSTFLPIREPAHSPVRRYITHGTESDSLNKLKSDQRVKLHVNFWKGAQGFGTGCCDVSVVSAARNETFHCPVSQAVFLICCRGILVSPS